MSEVTIAGGGLAGAAAACHLARAGRRVALFERAAGPAHKICGEFLSPRAQRELAGLGIDLAALGAHRIDRLRLVRGARAADIRLPFVAAGLTRCRLDEALLAQAAATGAAVHRGAAFAAPAARGPVFLATGKHELRAHPRDAAAPDLVGFKTYFRLSPAMQAAIRHTIELHLFADGYAGLQLVEHAANLCLVVPRARLAAAGGDWPSLLASLMRDHPVLARRLDEATPLLARPLAIARVPFGFVHTAASVEPGLFRIGDQAGVIHAFAGDGMSLALGSARLAARVCLDGGTAERYAHELRRRIRGPIARSRWLYQLGLRRAGQSGMMAVAAVMPGAIGALAQMTRT